MPAKTPSKTRKPKPRNRVKASGATQQPTYAEVCQHLAESLQRENATAKELQDCKRQLTESLEQQTTTSEILRVIASSPTDLQPVLDVVAENAARLCESDDAIIRRLDGDMLRRVAHFGSLPTLDEDENFIVSRAVVAGRAVLAKETIHVHDLLAEMNTEYTRSRPWYRDTGTRTVLVTPLLRERVPVGVIVIRQTEDRPFTDKPIPLL